MYLYRKAEASEPEAREVKTAKADHLLWRMDITSLLPANPRTLLYRV